jgi:hypothetical protein
VASASEKVEVASAEPPLDTSESAAPETQQVALKPEPHHKPAVNRAASPAFGHAPDYSWVTGELWYVPGKNVWRVHFGNGREDRYGGVMTLSDTGPMSEYRIGQLVYVEGRPVEDGSRNASGIYRVTRVLELANPEGNAQAADGRRSEE